MVCLTLSFQKFPTRVKRILYTASREKIFDKTWLLSSEAVVKYAQAGFTDA